MPLRSYAVPGDALLRERAAVQIQAAARGRFARQRAAAQFGAEANIWARLLPREDAWVVLGAKRGEATGAAIAGAAAPFADMQAAASVIESAFTTVRSQRETDARVRADRAA